MFAFALDFSGFGGWITAASKYVVSGIGVVLREVQQFFWDLFISFVSVFVVGLRDFDFGGYDYSSFQQWEKYLYDSNQWFPLDLALTLFGLLMSFYSVLGVVRWVLKLVGGGRAI